MNAQHAPGPWTLDEGDGEDIFDAEGKCVARVMRAYDFAALSHVPVAEWQKADARCMASAKLITAAPKLLAALRLFVDHYPAGVNPDLDAAWCEARAAIAEATGDV